MWDILPDVAVIVISEILIDWIKHAFVTKFNGIPVETYKDYQVCSLMIQTVCNSDIFVQRN